MIETLLSDDLNWDAITALTSIIATFLVLLSFLFLAAQIREARRATVGQSLLGMINIVQSQEMREVRRRVFELRNKQPEEWTASEISDVERVCQSYDVYALLCRHKLIPVRVVADSWGDSIMRSWEICRPYVLRLRRERAAPEFWDDFEWLDRKARSLRWFRRFGRR